MFKIPANQIVPRGDTVLTRVVDQDTASNKIVIPDSARESADHWVAEIIKVGPGRVSEEVVLVPTELHVGQIVVLWPVYSQPMRVSDIANPGIYLLTRARDIVAVIDTEADPELDPEENRLSVFPASPADLEDIAA